MPGALWTCTYVNKGLSFPAANVRTFANISLRNYLPELPVAFLAISTLVKANVILLRRDVLSLHITLFPEIPFYVSLYVRCELGSVGLPLV